MALTSVIEKSTINCNRIEIESVALKLSLQCASPSKQYTNSIARQFTAVNADKLRVDRYFD